MSIWDKLKRYKKNNVHEMNESELHEFCPRCDAILTFQKGYHNNLPFWICKGCGEMLINPSAADDTIWICDKCDTVLSIQEGFSDNKGKWICKECGYVNRIDEKGLYITIDEYQSEQRNPYKGLSDEDILKLSQYQDIEHIENRPDIIIVKHRETGQRYVKKLLSIYDRSIYEYLKYNPVPNMPVIYEIYESDNYLILIEEYIDGRTIADIIDEHLLSIEQAINIGIDVCAILEVIHGFSRPIIHRDIKPSNIVITPESETYLLDMNVAKWYYPEKNDDTRYLGTRFYAAPEQVGYGLYASSAKSDVYALGILLNVMITGKLPKEERVEGKLWNIIERCISLDPDDRINVAELKDKLIKLRGIINAGKSN